MTLTDQAELREQIESLGFLEVAHSTGYVSFVSEPFRRYAVTRLRNLRVKVEEIVIDDLLNRTNDNEAESRLPSVLLRWSI